MGPAGWISEHSVSLAVRWHRLFRTSHEGQQMPERRAAGVPRASGGDRGRRGVRAARTGPVGARRRRGGRRRPRRAAPPPEDLPHLPRAAPRVPCRAGPRGCARPAGAGGSGGRGRRARRPAQPGRIDRWRDARQSRRSWRARPRRRGARHRPEARRGGGFGGRAGGRRRRRRATRQSPWRERPAARGHPRQGSQRADRADSPRRTPGHRASTDPRSGTAVGA
jgi:hypothetical protein